MFNEDVRDVDDEVSGLVRAPASSPVAPLKLAAFDLGSNSFHAVVAVLTDDSRFTVCARGKEKVQLGDSVFRTGRISADGFERALGAVRRLRELVRPHEPQAVLAMATSAIREASNGRELVQRASRIAGFPIQIIDGLEEARLACLGTRHGSGLRGSRSLLIDFGGGSTEIVLADDHGCQVTASLKLGFLRMRSELGWDRWPGTRDLVAPERVVGQAIEPTFAHVRRLGFDQVVLSCGTARRLLKLARGTHLSELDLEPPSESDSRLSVTMLRRLELLLAATDEASRSARPGVRAIDTDALLPGAIALRVMLEQAGVGQAVVSRTGLREGMIVDYIEKHRAHEALSLARASF